MKMIGGVSLILAINNNANEQHFENLKHTMQTHNARGDIRHTI